MRDAASGRSRLVRLAASLIFVCAAVWAYFHARMQSGVAPAVGELSPNVHSPEAKKDDGWPDPRGPNRDGRSPEIGLADFWPKEGPPILWRRPLGQGWLITRVHACSNTIIQSAEPYISPLENPVSMNR